MAKKQADAPAPNIQFIGKDETTDKLDQHKKPIVIKAEPLTTINNGEKKIQLPGVEEQLKGPFFHQEASTIVRLYPGLYKLHVAKGGK